MILGRVPAKWLALDLSLAKPVASLRVVQWERRSQYDLELPAMDQRYDSTCPQPKISINGMGEIYDYLYITCSIVNSFH